MKRLSLAAALSIVVLVATTAFGAQVGSEGQVATFNAKLSPGALPRDHSVPVHIRVEGEFKATPENHLAQLISLEVAVNRHGELVTKGLPACHVQELMATTSQQALELCRGALLGHGGITATTAFPDQKRQHYKATILAFNAKRPQGGPRVLLHIHGTAPGPFTVVIPVEVHRTQGTFGTAFFAEMPGFARRWAYLTKFRFVIGRRFSVKGKDYSAVRASCPAPKGLNGAVFPFARATYRFLATKTLRATLLGGCHVRKE